MSNLFHSSVSIELLMDYFPDVDLAQTNVLSDISKEVTYGKTFCEILAFNVSL